MKKVLYLSIILCFYSCERKYKNVDPFYTERASGSLLFLPIYKPTKLIYHRVEKKWILEEPHYFKQNMNIEKIDSIGIDNGLVYGKLDTIHYYIEDTIHKFRVVDRFNAIYSDIKPLQLENDEVRINPVGSNSKYFLLPKRWFIFNHNDSTIEAYFTEREYLDYLTNKGVRPKLHNIDTLMNTYVTTNVLPWFPDSIKSKLRK